MKKVMIITGGSDGLGKTLARFFTKNFNVIILSPNKEKLKMVANEIGCDFFVCDVSKYEQTATVVKKINEKYGHIDILINNAGLWIQGALEENDYDRIQQVIDVNLKGLINMTKSVVPFFKAKNDGIIININSQAGINYKAERTVYNSTKWGVTGFTKSLQPELAKFGIRITNLMPGMMKTEMFLKLGIEKDMEKGLETIEVARLINFIVELPKNVTIPEIGIKNINN